MASDVYEWAPGRFFVIHPAYGRIGEVDVRGVEVIGYDPSTEKYWSQFSHHERRNDDGSWVPSMEVVLTKVG
jgi:hypothetical protein